MLREINPQTTIWELLLPEAKRLPANCKRPTSTWTTSASWPRGGYCSPPARGRPSVPIDTLLRLLYLKRRYQLGYESLRREVADSIPWLRFCRIGLDRPVPHPTTLIKLVRGAGPEVIQSDQRPRQGAAELRRWWRVARDFEPPTPSP